MIFGCHILLMSVLFQSMSYTYDHEYNNNPSYTNDFLGLVSSALGVAAGVYGLGYCCGWWGAESNEQLIAAATRGLNGLERYRSMLTIIHQAGSSFDPKYSTDEALLYQLAFTKRGEAFIDAYISSLNSFMRDLRSVTDRVKERAADIKGCGDWEEIRTTGYRLDELNDRLRNALQQIEPLAIHLEKHRSYFKLFEYEDYVRNHYLNELEILDRYRDAYAFCEAIRACANSKYAGPFALIEFAKRLNYDIKALENLIARPAYHYATRIAYARDVVARLYHIERLMVSDNEYMRTLLEYQQKEYLKMQCERIQIERQKAYLRERQIYEQERGNRLRVAECRQGCY